MDKKYDLVSRKTKKTKEKEWTTLEVVALFVIMTICMSAAIFSCILSIRRISSENTQSDSMILAHMVDNGIESEFIKPIVVTETMSNDYSLIQYMIKSGSGSPEAVEKSVAAYLESIKDGFGYQMVYVVCDRSRAYYTYEGICEYIDIENDPNDIWYQHFLDQNKSYKPEVDTDVTNQWALSVFVVISVRERKASKELTERRKISLTDDMTGLFNRRAFEEDCVRIQEDDLVSRTTILMMDVNGLKKINDTFGHGAGDELIIGAAKCILTSMGEYGRIYRTGGDEFVALLECTADQLNDMLQTFEHITAGWKGTHPCRLSISKGIVVCEEHGDLTFDEMKELADRRMYEDKAEYYRQTDGQRRKT